MREAFAKLEAQLKEGFAATSQIIQSMSKDTAITQDKQQAPPAEPTHTLDKIDDHLDNIQDTVTDIKKIQA